MKATYDQLKSALKLANLMLFVHEPPDSRAVSNEFVALAAVECDEVNDEVMHIIDMALCDFATAEKANI